MQSLTDHKIIVLYRKRLEKILITAVYMTLGGAWFCFSDDFKKMTKGIHSL